MSSIHDPAYVPTRYRITRGPAAPASLAASDVPGLMLAARIGNPTADAVLCARCAVLLPLGVFTVTAIRGPRAYVPCARCHSVTYPPTTDMRSARLSVCADNV